MEYTLFNQGVGAPSQLQHPCPAGPMGNAAHGHGGPFHGSREAVGGHLAFLLEFSHALLVVLVAGTAARLVLHRKSPPPNGCPGPFFGVFFWAEFQLHLPEGVGPGAGGVGEGVGGDGVYRQQFSLVHGVPSATRAGVHRVLVDGRQFVPDAPEHSAAVA